MSAAELLTIAAMEGVVLVLEGGQLICRAGHQPPADLLASIKAHRLELIAEVAANDGHARRLHWTVQASGKTFTMISEEPITEQEALIEVRWRWPDATLH